MHVSAQAEKIIGRLKFTASGPAGNTSATPCLTTTTTTRTTTSTSTSLEAYLLILYQPECSSTGRSAYCQWHAHSVDLNLTASSVLGLLNAALHLNNLKLKSPIQIE